MSNRILLVCGVILVSIQLAFGHGYLQVPMSRNLLANKKGQEYCHHCLSAGGPSVVQSLTPGGKFPTPTETKTSAVRHAICGEAANMAVSSRKYNPYPAPQVSSLPVYQPGQVIDIEVVITAHHRGHFEFRLCDASTLSKPNTVDWACLNTVLQRVPVDGEASPVDVNHPERYYLEPECVPKYNTTIKMKYQLPANLTCERCIMQWWWVSANTCNPPDYDKRTPLPNHPGCNWWVPSLPKCGQSYPEEFWNCADINIGGVVAAPGTNNQPPPSVPPPSVPVAPPTQPAAPPVQPVAPPVAPVAPPVKPAAPPVQPVAPPAQPVAPPVKPVAPPVVPPAVPTSPPVAPPTKPAVPPAAPAKPVAPPAVPTTPPTQPVAPAPVAAPPSCSAIGSQCGGIGWTGATCCQSGSTCYQYTQAYSQCRPGGCPAGWLCAAESGLFTSAVEWVKELFQ